MSTNDPTRRILTEFGEPENFFGFTLGDLKLLIPALFGGMLVIGNTPAEIRTVGWSIASGLIVGLLILIYASPGHLTTEAWLKSRLLHTIQPALLTLNTPREAEDAGASVDFTPEIEDQRSTFDTATPDAISENLPNGSRPRGTQELTDIDRFRIDHRAGERVDGYMFGAVQVHPANMSLATKPAWEQAVNRFGRIVNGIEFPFQIYSTDTPVDPKRITQGYRERLGDQSADLKPEFRTLLRTYQEKLPHEFERRGTSVREYYVIVAVSTLEVHRDLNSVNESGILTKLEDLSYVGGFITTLRASQRDVSTDEVEAKQLAELDHRLTTFEEEITSLNGCTTTRVSMSELAALVKDFWEPGARSDDEPTPAVRTTPVVRGSTSIHPGGES